MASGLLVMGLALSALLAKHPWEIDIGHDTKQGRVKVITLERGDVPEERMRDFERSFQAAKSGSIPQGLELSLLFKIPEGAGHYTVMSLWSSREALQAMRNKEKPKAVALFDDAGVTPTVEIHEVVDTVRVGKPA